MTYTIHKLVDGTCEMSRKSGEMVVVSNEQHGLLKTTLSVQELVKLLRLDSQRNGQLQKQSATVVSKLKGEGRSEGAS